MKVGTAWVDITPSRKLTVAGQMSVRWAQYVHDPLTVNAVVFQKENTQVALVSCDLCLIPEDFILDTIAACSETTGIAPENIIIGATHTHVAPNTIDEIPGVKDPEFVASLKKSIISAVSTAIADIEDVDIYAGKGYIEQMGFNRRGMHHGNKCDMYYGNWGEGFEGLEGPRDGEVGVIFAKRPDDSIKVVIPSFSTHPNSIEGESFYSADVVGAVRIFLRKNLGDDVGIVYLTGAAGNTAPSDLENYPVDGQPWRNESGWKRSGMYLGSEILKTIVSTIKPMEDPELIIKSEVLRIPIRDYPKDIDISWDIDHFKYARENWAKWTEELSPFRVKVNAIRIGDAAICTNPAELYCEFGLSIKEKSPASVTLVSELTDGFVGYVATKEAYKHGGYSTWPAIGCKLTEDAGYQIVDATAELLEEAFKK